MKNHVKRSPQTDDLDWTAVYLLRNHLEPIENLMAAQSIMFQMLNEVVTFEKNRGVSEKSKASRERVLKLMEIFETFSLMYDQLVAARSTLALYLNRMEDQQTEIQQLQSTIEATAKAWSETN